MERTDNSLFQLQEGAQGVPAAQYTITQKWLEQSNVNLNREYTMLMEAQRSFQSCSTALQILDRMNQKAATQIASL